MKMSELKPCANCGGPLLLERMGTWHVLRSTQAMVSPQAANALMGLAKMFGGAVSLAEAFAPGDPVLIVGDREPSTVDEYHLCFECFCKPICLAEIQERVNRDKETGDE